jgi:glycosyltransferase involved in cell wall biosynthesis
VLQDHGAREELAALARANAERYTWIRAAESIFAANADPRSERAIGTCLRTVTDERPLRVLHITETFSAGTGMAIVGFARGTRDQGIESHLLAQDRGSGLLKTVQDDCPFGSAVIVPPGPLALWRAIGPAIESVDPDIVHAHSSVAGAVVRLRLAVRRKKSVVVYSPHCFAFERRDLSQAARGALRAAERVLATWTSAFVCVSPHETTLALDLIPGALVVDLVNSFDPVGEVLRPADEPATDAALHVVSIGRVMPQKDPAMFADVVNALRAKGQEVEAIWIGAGENHAAYAALNAADVHVTGWLAAQQIPDLMTSESVYVHSATWEAAVPIVVLDAMRLGVVVVVRRNGAYRNMIPSEWQFDDVKGAVRMILHLRDRSARKERVQQQLATLQCLHQRGPHAVLSAAYHEILSAKIRRPGVGGQPA